MKPSLANYVPLLCSIFLIALCLLERRPVPLLWRIWLWSLLLFLIGIFIALLFV